MMHFSTLAAGLALMSTTGMAQYVLEDDYFSGNFFDQFSFFTASDPTHGFVQFQSESAAQSQSLISSSASNAYIGVDHTSISSGAGRNAVRLTSNKAYNNGLVIIDLAHMPTGCGTWPAFWMVGPSWPTGGEIDIIEGVHTQTTNDMTLHTGPGCTINPGTFSGSITTSNCDINAPGQGTNQGCSIGSTNTNTYGAGFNAAGGGIYATEITSSAISIFFFEHGSAPSDIHSANPNPANWGEPIAIYQGGCDIAEHFTNLQLVFDTTFCGDWAGAVWGNFPTCSAQATTCQSFVQNNPNAFTEAYWSVNSLKVYSASSSSDKFAPAAAAPLPVSTTTSSQQPVTTPPPPPAATTPQSSMSVHVQTATTGWEWDGGSFEYNDAKTKRMVEDVPQDQHEHQHEDVHQHLRRHTRPHGARRL